MMLDAFCEMNPNVETMELDVFEDNVSARNLYERRGFKVVEASDWRTRDVEMREDATDGWVIKNCPTAAAWLSSYGFCEYDLRIGGAKRRFGQIGRGVLRVFNEEDFCDDSFLAGAAAIIGRDATAFHIGPRNPGIQSIDSDLINVSLRMTYTKAASR